MDRLSVSFAPEYERERLSWSDADYPPQSPGEIGSDASVKVNVFNMMEQGGGGTSPSPVMPPGQGQSPSFYQGNRLSAVVSGLIVSWIYLLNAVVFLFVLIK